VEAELSNLYGALLAPARDAGSSEPDCETVHCSIPTFDPSVQHCMACKVFFAHECFGALFTFIWLRSLMNILDVHNEAGPTVERLATVLTCIAILSCRATVIKIIRNFILNFFHTLCFVQRKLLNCHNSYNNLPGRAKKSTKDVSASVQDKHQNTRPNANNSTTLFLCVRSKVLQSYYQHYGANKQTEQYFI